MRCCTVQSLSMHPLPSLPSMYIAKHACLVHRPLRTAAVSTAWCEVPSDKGGPPADSGGPVSLPWPMSLMMLTLDMTRVWSSSVKLHLIVDVTTLMIAPLKATLMIVTIKVPLFMII